MRSATPHDRRRSRASSSPSSTPDIVIIKPCGFTLERTLEERSVFAEVLPWRSWRAVADGKVFVADGNAFFNRPGPRIVESLEIMAACIHPEAFRDFAHAHRESYVRIDRDLAIEHAGAAISLRR